MGSNTPYRQWIETNLTTPQFPCYTWNQIFPNSITLVHKTRLETIGIIATVVAAAAGVSQAWTAWQAYQSSQQNSPSNISSSPSPAVAATPNTFISSSPSPAVAATPNTLGGGSLASEVGADYTKLRDLLVAQKYKEADQETTRMMLYVSLREKEGWLDAKAIENFPCQDLRTINQLWLQNSNQRFGFSVQNEIYNQVGKDWRKLYDQVGWQENDKFRAYNELIFEMRAPRGHLPRVRSVDELGREVEGMGVRDWGYGVVWVAHSRIETCKL
ncbi:MAG: GUN4 domain-containing protein [Coleofasciculaceae cyanobacterium SM2_1_6]|nr:GUN4 domain-containing protein [Coleofasciculaceae cyanobacterium SM2_1_6]